MFVPYKHAGQELGIEEKTRKVLEAAEGFQVMFAQLRRFGLVPMLHK